MNIDIRVNNNFFEHPKTVVLQKELGEIAPMFLIRLWIYASKFFPNGIIKNMDDEIIEEQIGWTKNHSPGFIQILEKIGFIEKDGNSIIIHDWDEHNQWASNEKNRKDLNRFNTLARYFPNVAKLLKNNNINSISADQYKAIKAAIDPVKEASKIFKFKLPEKNANSDIQPHLQSNIQSNVQSHIRPQLQSQCEPKMPLNQIPNTISKPNTKDSLPPTPQIPNDQKAEYEREKMQSDSSSKFEDDIPSIEFIELREYYDKEARPEGPRAGWIEFKRLKHQTGKFGSGYFPGIYRLMDDISERIENGFWDKGYEPGLAKYLNDRTWEQEIKSRRKSEIKTFEERAEDAEKARKERILKRLKAIHDEDNQTIGG